MYAMEKAGDIPGLSHLVGVLRTIEVFDLVGWGRMLSLCLVHRRHSKVQTRLHILGAISLIWKYIVK